LRLELIRRYGEKLRFLLEKFDAKSFKFEIQDLWARRFDGTSTGVYIDDGTSSFSEAADWALDAIRECVERSVVSPGAWRTRVVIRTLPSVPPGDRLLRGSLVEIGRESSDTASLGIQKVGVASSRRYRECNATTITTANSTRARTFNDQVSSLV
jgi:hypothetical protein